MIHIALRSTAALIFASNLLVPVAFADNLTSRLDDRIEQLWGTALGERPATPLLLLWEMAVDEERAARILSVADTSSRALTDSLLSTLALSEPLAFRQLPALHIVRDQNPAGIDQSPTWNDLRRAGLPLIERIALDPANGRDQRLLRELKRARAEIERWTPSEVGGLVHLWLQWWTDRGDSPQFYLLREQVPDVSAWLDRYANPDGPSERSMWEIIGRLHDDPLRARLFVEGLDPHRHAFLLAECMEILGSYPKDFERRALPVPQWNPSTGRLDGYRPERLREVALEVLTRVSSFFPDGVNEHERIRSCFSWWKRARLQAQHYRDPHDAPDLSDYLEGWEFPEAGGGNSIARLLRRLYIEHEIRPVILDRFGPRHAATVAELMEWLRLDLDQAKARGFEFSFRLEPIRPVPSQSGPLAVIPLVAIHEIIRDLLTRVSDYELPFSGLSGAEQDALWQRWWEGVRHQPRWHRGEAPEIETEKPLFQPERARRTGR